MTLLKAQGVETEAELAFAGLTELLRPGDRRARAPSRRPGRCPPQRARAQRRAGKPARRAGRAADPARPARGIRRRCSCASTTRNGSTSPRWKHSRSRPAASRPSGSPWSPPSAARSASRSGSTHDAQLVITGLSDTDSRALLEDRAGISGAGRRSPAAGRGGQPARAPRAAGSWWAPCPWPKAWSRCRSGHGSVRRSVTGSTGCRPRPGSRWAWSRRTASPDWPRRSTRSRCSGSSSTPCKPPRTKAWCRSTAAASSCATRCCVRSRTTRSSPHEQREVHAALATALERPSDLERRTWHRAAAALGPDEAVARGLDDVARNAERRGALATTAHGFARAASLSVDDDARATRLLAGADAWLAAGHWKLALDQLDQARARTRSIRACGPTSRRRPVSSRRTAPDRRRARRSSWRRPTRSKRSIRNARPACSRTR